MANVVLPFLMSMLLGRTIDLRTYKISGTNVYDDAEYDETPIGDTNTVYHVIQNNTFPYTFFGMPLDIVLRIKSNFLSSSSGAMGMDGLLKDTSWKHNSVVVTVTSVHLTVDRSVKDEASPIPGWVDNAPTTETHYVESLVYGGWSVVLFRLQCDIPADVEAVKKVVTRQLGKVGTLKEDTIGKWHAALDEIMQDTDIRGTVGLSTQVYSTVEQKDPIDSPEALMKSIQDLPGLVGPLGQPLFVNLESLNQLDERFEEVTANNAILDDLGELDQMLDDVKDTRVRIMSWMSETLTAFDENQEATIASMLNVLNEFLRAFNKVGAEVSIFGKMDPSILDSAYNIYLSNLERGLPNYNMAFRRLKEEVDAECDDSFLHKIKGLLRVYAHEVQELGTVKGGLQDCQQRCYAEQRCRAIGYTDELAELDLTTGMYLRRDNQCWIYYRSSGTATVYTPNDLSGDLGVYDRKCY